MRICFLFNPHAGGTDTADVLHEAVRRVGLPDGPDLAFHEASDQVSLCEQAKAAAREGFDVVVAVGGDGTVHEVANGLLAAPRHPDDLPALAIVPLGTGNDLARTLALPLDDLDAALALLRDGARRRIDVVRVSDPASTRYAVNVCAGGFSGQVDEVLTPELKGTWGPLAYLVGAAKTLPDLTDYDTRLTFDDGPPERVDAFNIVVANGRTAAGGKPAAPRASPEDGLLDVVVVRRGSALDLVKLATLVFAGDYLTSDQVLYRQVRRLTVESKPGMWFNVDGELHTKEPVTFEAVARALPVVVGPGYTPEAPAAGEPTAGEPAAAS